MDQGSRVTTRTAAISEMARPRPPSPGERTQGRMMVRVLPDPKTLSVLIADDCPDTADSLAQLVRLWGHDAWAVYSGGDALALAFAHQPDVLILDIGMPDMDGFCLAQSIRRQFCSRSALLVAVTGYADHAHRQLGMQAGFDHYLAKPVELSILETLLLTACVRKANRHSNDEV
jgi:CheY-like chemotaxis protein